MKANGIPKKWRISAMVLASALALAACHGKDDTAGQQMPPPVVSVVTAQPTTVTVSTQLTGRLQPIREAQVRARAAGILQKRLFAEGGYVKAGQPLFQIDNAPYVAQLDTAKASLATAEANLAKADADVMRYRPLVAANAISKQEFDAAIAQQRLARAQVQSARASIKTAQINVGYAYVTAPISGRIGKALVTEGALVGQGDVTQLALIQQTDTLYVDLNQSAQQAMKVRQAIAEGKMKMVNGNPEVTIYLDDGSEYPEKGRLLFTDMTVDESTGQVSVRAEVPNTGNILLPGQFVRVAIPEAQIDNAILIPQQAVSRGSQGDTVMVVNADGGFAPRPVTIARQQGNNWIITGGLKAGDKVIVDGLSAVQMTGAKTVKTQPWKGNQAAAPAQQPAASQPAAHAASGSKSK
ncbi:efflux RND transporter periplasmic adaptor subunit [Snodgrassella sp. CFCC 13594]|uniref:efflux RND transporter periplasmic adaptor subunit n=1 Tax=Snodgrassella sp. CFCC 13594 TaxID=1775559 RepID=UPI000831D79B|nr:efflux RND transporter periplasmic adaptor subunit [Snodgrassella sp. CFCC 13594]